MEDVTVATEKAVCSTSRRVGVHCTGGESCGPCGVGHTCHRCAHRAAGQRSTWTDDGHQCQGKSNGRWSTGSREVIQPQRSFTWRGRRGRGLRMLFCTFEGRNPRCVRLADQLQHVFVRAVKLSSSYTRKPFVYQALSALCLPFLFWAGIVQWLY